MCAFPCQRQQATTPLQEGDSNGGGWEAVDDVHGGPLPPDLVKAARRREVDYLRGRKVYEYASIREARRRSHRGPLRLKWIDTNKGTFQKPNVRTRYVAREIANGVQDDIFAPTPSLQALKIPLSNFASQSRKGMGDWRLMVLDVSRVFFCAPALRERWVELPDEDPDKHRGYVGRLIKAMCGTRDAPWLGK